MMNFSRILPYILSILSWFVVELGNSYSIHHRREIWDNTEYFTMGLPFLYIVAGLIGWFFPDPKKSWQWGVIPFVTQFCIMLIRNPDGNMMPLGIILLGILSLPGVALACLGTYLRNR